MNAPASSCAATQLLPVTKLCCSGVLIAAQLSVHEKVGLTNTSLEMLNAANPKHRSSVFCKRKGLAPQQLVSRGILSRDIPESNFAGSKVSCCNRETSTQV